MNRTDFQELAETRLADVDTLIKQARYDAAYYLAGYAIECALKACIAKQTREHEFPPRKAAELYQHDSQKLLELAGLTRLWLDEIAADAELGGNWDVVKA